MKKLSAAGLTIPAILTAFLMSGEVSARTLHINLIGGQSNAVGGGYIQGDADAQSSNPGYYKQVRNTLYASRIYDKLNPETPKSDFEIPALRRVQPHPNGRFGVELSLARHMKNKPDADWGAGDIQVFLKYASSGTSILRMMPGDDTGLHAAMDEYLRDQIARIHRTAAKHGYDVEFGYLFWIHGEANSGAGAVDYLSNFQAYAEYLHASFGDFTPVFARLQENKPERPGIKIINDSMCAVYACTAEKYLPLKDYWHYTGDAVIELGLLLGKARDGLAQ